MLVTIDTKEFEKIIKYKKSLKKVKKIQKNAMST